MGRKAHPLAARIKKMMQTDEEVGKIAQATPVMIARAMELFLQRLCTNATEIATSRKAKTLTTSHLKAYVASDELMDFLEDTVSKAPDLPPEGEPEQPKPKRQRTEPKAKAEGKAAADAAPAAAAAAPAAASSGQQPKQPEAEPGSPAAHPAKLGQGFGGMGAHPLLKARAFNKPGAKKGASASPKPEEPKQHLQQQKDEPTEADAAMEAEQPPSAAIAVNHHPGDAAGLPVLPGMLSVQALAHFQNRQDNEDDYDEDYDS